MDLFDKYNGQTFLGVDLELEFKSVIEPIIQKYADKGG